MAHYAFLNEHNNVTEVIVGVDEDQLIESLSPEQWYGQFRGQRCIRTSYNGNIRGRFAGIGDTYDEERDVFLRNQPFPSWVLNETTTEWESPVPMPTDGRMYVWVEPLRDWFPIPPSIPFPEES